MPYDPELIAKLRAAKTTPKTGYNPELIAQLRAKKQSEPTMWERFKAGFMGKEIPQPKGFEKGDIAELAGSAGLETLGGTLGTPLGPIGIGLGAAAGKYTHEIIKRGLEPTKPYSREEDIGTVGRVAGEGLLQATGAKYLPGAAKFIGTGLQKASALVSEGTKKLSDRVINSLIKPKMVDFVYGKNPGRAVANEGIIASSLEDLTGKISDKIKDVGELYKPLINQHKDTVIDLSKSLNPIDEAISKVSDYPSVNKEIIGRLNEIRTDLIQNLVKRDVSGNWGVNPESAIALKREIGAITKFTGNHSDDATVNKALKQVYHNIDKKLDDAIPGIQGINERYADLLGARTAAKWRAALLSRQDLTHLPELATGVGAGLLTMNPLTGIGTALAHKVISSTPAKTIEAQMLRGLGAKIESGTKLARQAVTSKPVTTLGRYSIPSVVSSSEELMRKYNSKK